MKSTYSCCFEVAKVKKQSVIFSVLFWFLLLTHAGVLSAAETTGTSSNATNNAANTTTATQSEDPRDNPNGGSCNGEADQDVGSAGNNAQPLSLVGNPVSLITGNKYQIEKDYNSPASRLQLFRHYNSTNYNYNVGFGRGWNSTYSTSLRKVGKQGYDIAQGTGQRTLFRESKTDDNGRVTWHATSPSDGYLWADDKRYYWELPDGRHQCTHKVFF